MKQSWPNDKNTRLKERIEKANNLISLVSSTGHQYFSHYGMTSRLGLDAQNRVWLWCSDNSRLIYTHNKGEWKYFDHGATLRAFIEDLRDYVLNEQTIHIHLLEIFAGIVKTRAKELGIVKD